jgi:hypothetical protein
MNYMYKNATGFNSSDYSIPTFDFGFGSGSGSGTSKPSTTSKGSGFDWAGTIGSAVNIGSTIYASEAQRKIAQKQADALIAQGVSQERVAQLILEGKRLDLETAKAGAGASSGGNKTLYIALGVGGVVILGLVIFVVTRKK